MTDNNRLLALQAIIEDNAADRAKLALVAKAEGLHLPAPAADPQGAFDTIMGNVDREILSRRRKPVAREVLISPPEAVALALITINDEADALAALLDAPKLTPQIVARMVRAVRLIREQAMAANSAMLASRRKSLRAAP